MLIMCLLRCLHPRQGALALLVVLADPDSARLGRDVGTCHAQRCMHAAIALAYNNLTRVRYPKNAEPAPAIVAPHIPGRPALRLKTCKAMEQMDAFIDVTPKTSNSRQRHYTRRLVCAGVCRRCHSA